MPPSRRADLIEAAMRVFARHGFHGTCLDKVLQEGGVSRMTLYNHFASKDDLILAALGMRDEILREQITGFVEGRADDPVGRLLAVFDFHERWFADREFCGCMFINAAAEFGDPESPIRHAAADHKAFVVRFLRSLCEEAGLADPASLAEQLALLLDGATVMAQVVGQVGHDGATAADAARQAKQAACRLIDAARPD